MSKVTRNNNYKKSNMLLVYLIINYAVISLTNNRTIYYIYIQFILKLLIIGMTDTYANKQILHLIIIIICYHCTFVMKYLCIIQAKHFSFNVQCFKKNLPYLVIFHSWRVYRTRSKIYGRWYFKANVPSFKSDQSYLFLAKVTYLRINFII